LTFAGDVTGAGGFGGNILFSDSYSPGLSPAVVTFDGNLAFDGSNVLTLEIGGPPSGNEYDRLLVSGNCTMGGALKIVLINDFTPGMGEMFDLLVASQLLGQFGTVNLPAGYGPEYVHVSDTTLTFGLVPEPASLCLIGLGGLLVLRRRR
jgi:hypothetical protein